MSAPNGRPSANGGSWARPDRPWVCGRSRTGAGCREGPDPSGRCPVRAECRPQRDGQHWLCTRPAEWGGPCEDGPRPDGSCARPLPPCAPVRSLFRRRGALGRFAAVGCVAALAAVLGSPSGSRFASPGELASPHRAVSGECGSCHPGAGPGGSWIASALQHADVSQSELCLRCHDLGASGARTHGLAPLALAERSARATRGQGPVPARLRLARLGAGVAYPADGSLACATCHREHRGVEGELAEVSDLRCQTCHASPFRDLAHGHPEFSHYPYARRTRIVFDHGSHRGKHFPRREAEFRCMGCHEPDAAGAGMQVVGWERACSACHADDVSAAALRAGQRGIAFSRAPAPEGAATPFLRLLGAGDPPRAPEELLAELAERGPAALGEQLAAVAGRALRPDELRALAGGLPRELLALAGGGGPADADAPPDRARERFVEAGGWFWQASDASLRYRPGGHADAFVRGWLDLAGELAAGPEPARAAAHELFDALAARDAPGRCGYCHSADGPSVGDAAAPLRMNWAAHRASPRAHAATRFVHRPHLSLQDREGCTTCHALEPQADYLASFAHRDPQGPFASGFRPMTRELCAACHTRAAAGDTCVSCHPYHWGEFEAAFPSSPEGEAPAPAAAPPAESGADSGSDELL